MATPVSTSELIPEPLLADIQKGDCVLFLGADLPLGYPGAPLSWPELAANLAARHRLPRHLSWPETARAYLDRPGRDRNSLITFVAERNRGPRVKPGAIHHAIARAGFRAIVSAWYDELLEEALQQAGRRVSQIVHDVQLPYAQEGEDETIVIKLYGTLSDAQSLVLDSWDLEEWLVGLSRKLEVVSAFCALRPPLFVGFDLMERIPMHLYVRASTNLVKHMRRAYAVWPHPLDQVEAAWRGKNVHFVQADAAEFLQALSARLPNRAAGTPASIRVQRPPYKFLDYYEPADADIFCGRDTEAQLVTRLALTHRLVTVFGPSGAGKTSLLLAGVLPRLMQEGYQYVYVRTLDNPLPALRKAVAARLGRSDWRAGGTLRAFLEGMLAPEDKLIIVLDQLEEMFLRVGSRIRTNFFRDLGTVIDQPEREVRFVVSLREDYLARLDEARGYLPDIFSHSFRLAALERGSARLAITEPAARAGILVEAALVDALIGSPSARPIAGRNETEEAGDETLAGDLVESDGYVPPAALQIVLDRLYRQALGADHSINGPPPPGLTLTLADYRSIRHRLGDERDTEELQGARAILAGYVHEGLTRLPGLLREDGQTPLGADAALGAEILKVVVTSQATKAALTQDEILCLLDEAGVMRADNASQRTLVENTRLGLEKVRLLRSFERDGVALYELTHDHLAAEIATWISQDEMQAKLVRELLHRQMDNWRHAGLLIPLEALQLIHERRDELKRLSAEELELILHSALAAEYEVAYWFERARRGGVAVNDIALARLEDTNFRIRIAAVTALGQLGKHFIEPIIGRLADDYPQVRAAAITALENLQPEGSWRKELRYECYVPAGEFVMGEGHAAHGVQLDAFYIGRYPVSCAEYKRYMDDIGRAYEIPPGKANHPVVNVSWFDARDYAAWAGMRLLSEAEWEKAASWDETHQCKRHYPWGDLFEPGLCNTEELGVAGTTPVGKFSPQGDSPYGCGDMAGNVWEWTSSLDRPYPYRADDGREEADSSDQRVLRGGGFNNRADFARTTYRSRNYPDLHLWNLGFRVGLSANGRPVGTRRRRGQANPEPAQPDRTYAVAVVAATEITEHTEKS